jgi:GntR family transcriptional regulator
MQEHRRGPKYLAVREMLLELLDGMVYPPGSQLPSETELADQFRVSRVVVREALRSLEDEGRITRRHGTGTFVNAALPQLRSRLDLNVTVSEIIRANGRQPGNRLVEWVTAQADPVTAKRLRISRGALVVTLRRVRTADGHPVVYSEDTVPQALLGELGEVQLRGGSLYEFLQQERGQVLTHAQARLLPTHAGPDIGRKLGVPETAMLLLIEQIDLNQHHEPILYTRLYFLHGAFEFTLQRRRGTAEELQQAIAEPW